MGHLPNRILTDTGLVAYWRLDGRDVWRHGGIVDAINANVGQSSKRYFATAQGAQAVGGGAALCALDQLAASTAFGGVAADYLKVPDAGAAVLSYAATVAADSPALYWRLGESSGTSAADTSGNGRAGTYAGGYTQGIAGALTGDANTAVSFNGVTGTRVRLPGYFPLAVGASRTIDGWAWRNGTSNYDCLWASETNDEELFVVFGSTDVTFRVAGTGVTWASAWPGNAQWVHWAITFNESTDVAELFINGVSQGTKSQTATPAGTNFTIGDSNGFSGALNGKLDDVAVYNSILSAARISAHYNAGLALGGAGALDLTSDLTIVAVLNVTSFPSNRGILSKLAANGVAAPYDMRINNTAGQVIFTVGDGVTSFGANDGSAIPTGVPVMVAVTMSGTTMTFYRNGVQAGGTASIGAQARAGAGRDLNIGRKANATDPFLGSMGDVALFNRALSATDVLALAVDGGFA